MNEEHQTFENIAEVKPGDHLAAELMNALIRRAKATPTGTLDGYSDETANAHGSKHQFSPPAIHATNATGGAIPEYSVFTLYDTTGWEDPPTIKACKMLYAGGGSPLGIFTNGSIAIPDGAQMECHSIGFECPVEVTFTAAKQPLPGEPCGVDYDTLSICNNRYGLVCISESQSSPNRVWVLRSRDPVAVVGQVATTITAFDPLTNTLGSGTITLKLRNTTTGEKLANLLRPSTGAAWTIKVWNRTTRTASVGQIVSATETMGIGLVWNPDQNRELLPFELTANLVYGVDPGADNAKLLEWDGTNWVLSSTTIRVFDWTNITATPYGSWTGRPTAGSLRGYRGLCYRAESGRLEIVWMEEQAKWLKAKLNSRLKYNAASVGGTLVDDWDGMATPTGTITLYNSVTNVGGVYEFYGPTDAVCFCVFDDSTGKHWIIHLEHDARYIEGTYATASAGTVAFTAGVAAGATVTNYWDGKNPGGTVTVKDPQGLFPRALQGGKFKAVWNERADGGDGAYIVFESQTKAGSIDFTLTTAFGGGSSLAATVQRYGGVANDILDPGPTAEVFDNQNIWKYCPIGANGQATYDAKIDKYRVVYCEGYKFSIRGKISGALGATGTGTITSSSGGGVAPTGPVTLQNPGSFFVGSGGEEYQAHWDASTGNWVLDWVECP